MRWRRCRTPPSTSSTGRTNNNDAAAANKGDGSNHHLDSGRRCSLRTARGTCRERGDFNLDSTVDAAVYVVWRKTNDMQAGYNLWRAHFGQTADIGAGANATIPEPRATLLLLAV